MNSSCIVLAGGRGERLGRDKISQLIAGENLLERVVSCLSLLDGEVIVVKAQRQGLPALSDYSRLKFVEDIYPGKGPLGGIFTGLSVSSAETNLVVAGDMPFLNRELLRYMLDCASGFDLVLPRLGEMVEPLHAVYSRHCKDIIRSLLEQGTLMVHRLIPLARVRYIEQDEIDKFDPAHLSFFNINTEADLERARKLAQGNHDNC